MMSPSTPTRTYGTWGPPTQYSQGPIHTEADIKQTYQAMIHHYTVAEHDQPLPQPRTKA